MKDNDESSESDADQEGWDDDPGFIPPNDEDISDASDDLLESDIDEMETAGIESCSSKTYKAKNGLVWKSAATFELGRFATSITVHGEKFMIPLTGIPKHKESSYFSLLITDNMLRKYAYWSELTMIISCRISRIVVHTNDYGSRMNSSFQKTDFTELKAVVGLLYLIATSRSGMPVDYAWSTNPYYGIQSMLFSSDRVTNTDMGQI